MDAVPESPNMAAARAGADAYERDGIAGFLDHLETIADPEVAWREDPSWPDHAEVVGIDAIRTLMQERFESTEFDVEVEELFERRDRVLALQRWTAQGRSSGASAALEVATVTRFAEGRITEVVFYLDRAAARKEFETSLT
jgi:ketosteroid isomerase-like protein